jgi:DNA-binding response OmpR family regulator
MFTNSYPPGHRNFTEDNATPHRFPSSLSESSSRSYYGGELASESIAGDTNPERTQALSFGNLEIRPDELQALANGVRVGLTVREFQVLMVLAQREDHVVRRTDIYTRVWGGEMKKRDRSVDVFVRKVRNKLAKAAPGWTYIHTHFGVGYRFAASPAGEGRSSDRGMTDGVLAPAASIDLG